MYVCRRSTECQAVLPPPTHTYIYQASQPLAPSGFPHLPRTRITDDDEKVPPFQSTSPDVTRFWAGAGPKYGASISPILIWRATPARRPDRRSRRTRLPTSAEIWSRTLLSLHGEKKNVVLFRQMVRCFLLRCRRKGAANSAEHDTELEKKGASKG